MKSLELDKKESTIMGIRLSFFKEEHPIKLLNSNGEPFVGTTLLGLPIDSLPKCLDPKSEGIRYLTNTS